MQLVCLGEQITVSIASKTFGTNIPPTDGATADFASIGPGDNGFPIISFEQEIVLTLKS